MGIERAVEGVVRPLKAFPVFSPDVKAHVISGLNFNPYITG